MKDAEISEKRALLRASLASGKPLAQQDVDEQVRKDYAYDESRKDLSKEEAMDLDDEVCFPSCNGLSPAMSNENRRTGGPWSQLRSLYTALYSSLTYGTSTLNFQASEIPKFSSPPVVILPPVFPHCTFSGVVSATSEPPCSARDRC